MIGKPTSSTQGFRARPYSPPTPTAYLNSTPRFEFKGIPSDVFFFARASQQVLAFIVTVGFN